MVVLFREFPFNCVVVVGCVVNDFVIFVEGVFCFMKSVYGFACCFLVFCDEV